MRAMRGRRMGYQPKAANTRASSGSGTRSRARMAAAPLFNLVLLVLGNVTFLLLDLALERLSALWRRKLRKRFFR